MDVAETEMPLETRVECGDAAAAGEGKAGKENEASENRRACAARPPQLKGGAPGAAAQLLLPGSESRASRRHSSDGVSSASQRGAAPPLACYSPMDVLELDNRRLKRQVSKLKLSLALTEADKQEREDASRERRLAVPRLSSLLDLEDEVDLSGLDSCLHELEEALPAPPPMLSEPLSPAFAGPRSPAFAGPRSPALAEPRSPALAGPRSPVLAERRPSLLAKQRPSPATERKSPVERKSPECAQHHLRSSRGEEPRRSLQSARSDDMERDMDEVASPPSPQAQRAVSDQRTQFARAQMAANAAVCAQAQAEAEAAAAAAAAAAEEEFEEEEKEAAHRGDSKWAALYRELVTSESFRLVGSGESCLDKLSHGCRRDLVLRYCDILDAIRRQAAKED